MTIPHSAAPAEWGMPFGMISSKPHTKTPPAPYGAGGVSHDLTGCAFPLVYNIHRSLHAGALCVGADQGTDLLGDAALTADDPAHILRGHTQLQRQLIAGF